MTPAEQSDLIRRLALAAGFDRVGVAPARRVARAAYFEDWLARGRAGEMAYLARHRSLRVDPRRLLPGARSVVSVAVAMDDEKVRKYLSKEDYLGLCHEEGHLTKKLLRIGDKVREFLVERGFDTNQCLAR